MSEARVILDARGADSAELSAAVATLLAIEPRVEVAHADVAQLTALTESSNGRTLPVDLQAAQVPRERPLLVATARAVYARGSIDRVLADLATPGRCLTAVLVPGSVMGFRVACWSPAWLKDFTGTLAGLVDADLDFDRAHLAADSPLARAWLRGDAVGIAPVGSVGEDPMNWARRTGMLLQRDTAVAWARAPLGAARRRTARWRQRRTQAHRVGLG